MFPASSNTDSQVCNFDSEENAQKWKRLFLSSLQKVLKQVHPTLAAKEDALEYVESLILRLLSTLCAKPAPHTVQDVEERVQRTFPNPIDRWAIGDAQAAIEKGRKKSPLVLPAEKAHPLLRDVLHTKIDYQVTLYIVAVLEYISADILKLAGNYVKNIRHIEVTQQDIRVAMCADKVLMDMFQQDEYGESSGQPEDPNVDISITFDELVKDLIQEKKTYIRELNMIIKVFRDKLQQIPSLQESGNRELEIIFSNITEIYDFSVNLLGSLEDTMEVTEENESPAIGICFEEQAEEAEFDVYAKYASDVTRPECAETLAEVVSRPDVSDALTSAGHGFKEAVKYYLPKLLLVPVYHVFTYFKDIEMLLSNTESEEGRESLEQVKGLLCPLQSQLERNIHNSPYSAYLKRKLNEINSRHRRQSRQQTLIKMKELQRSIDGWEGKVISQCCNEFVLEGDLLKLGATGRKLTERHVFLFDGLIVLCKSNNRRSSVTGQVGEYRFKEKFLMRMVEILDREDTEEVRHSFEIRPRDQPSVVLLAKNVEDKNTWMAALVMLNTRSMLERTLDSILLDEEKQHPLRLPDPSVYQFAIEDSESNIIIEEKENSGTPLIKGATLPKLVERLTYHMYADPMFVRTFLTTYRSFCTPMELLELLIQRFDIPEPELPEVSEEETQEVQNQQLSINREIMKRFRKEYSQPVQFRVLNVLRHWVDYHFYDFERDQSLLENLTNFLDKVKGKSMRKWVESITKIIQRRCNEEQREITFSLNRSPPSPKWHIKLEEKDWEAILPIGAGGTSTNPDYVRPLLMLHPIEIARQLTLLEFDLYRAVKPSELVGTPWTKEGKEKRSPNLLKLIYHTNNVTRWFMRCIVETENFEERVAVMCRIVEIMVMFHDLNNFSGIFEIVSALGSAAVHRLEHTKMEVWKRIPPAQLRIFEEASEISENHCKKYQEKLRSINPPCVPFFGMYLTNILLIEEGNPDFLPRAAEGLINFSKRRKVAEITGEIQQYQNQPYCLEVEPRIRHFLETLQPFDTDDETRIANYLYDRSKEIEPKNCKKPPIKERRWHNSYLKSPGIKPRNKVPNPLPGIFLQSERGPKLNEGAEGDDMTTPPTPNTPSSPSLPQHHQAPHISADNAVFAPVELGTGNVMSNEYRYVPPQAPPPPPVSSQVPPPPLPPRAPKREPSVGDTSPKVKQAPDAPELPPRDVSPPPIPPRTATLPRMHSSMGLQHGPDHHHHAHASLIQPLHSISLHHQLPHHHHTHHHRIHPSFLAPPPPPQQYQLDPPPHRRNNSVDLSSPTPLARRHTNGPHAGLPGSSDGDAGDQPPTPPPRLSCRQTFSFTSDPHHS
uniref:Ras-GEF domain-containing protein n=1 Tax=Scylla olivacea TaxID=85551 RepID=A0A0P4W486_SCYOL